MNPKIEETVKALKWCEYGDARTCEACPTSAPECREELMLIAADLIADLQQELIDERYRHDRLQDFCVAQGEELSKLKAQQRWIPATERLPEIAMRVIVNSNYGRSIGQFIISSHGGIFMYDYTGQQMSGITHWMPLPKPPKEV